MSSPALLTGYCALILLASLAGGWVPLVVRLTHTRMQVATSFVAGLMLGVGVLHLMPHSWHELKSIDRCAFWLTVGFLAMFLIQRFFGFHQHDVPDGSVPNGLESHSDHYALPAHGARHEHRASSRQRSQGHTRTLPAARQLSWTGAALGLTLHTLIDGFAVAASVELGSQGGRSGLLGFDTFLVVILHKPFDALAISTLMAAGGWSRAARHWANALFAAAIPAGMLAFHFGSALFSGSGIAFLGAALAFVAGSFLCIAASDLLPELQFHTHDRIKLTVALLTGLAVSAAIGRLEATGHEVQSGSRASESRVVQVSTHELAAPAAAVGLRRQCGGPGA